MNRIYCCPLTTKKYFIERHSKKEWSDKQDRDDLAFWDQQEREYLKENPTHLALFEGLEEGAEAAEGETDGVIAIL